MQCLYLGLNSEWMKNSSLCWTCTLPSNLNRCNNRRVYKRLLDTFLLFSFFCPYWSNLEILLSAGHGSRLPSVIFHSSNSLVWGDLSPTGGAKGRGGEAQGYVSPSQTYHATCEINFGLLLTHIYKCLCLTGYFSFIVKTVTVMGQAAEPAYCLTAIKLSKNFSCPLRFTCVIDQKHEPISMWDECSLTCLVLAIFSV